MTDEDTRCTRCGRCMKRRTKSGMGYRCELAAYGSKQRTVKREPVSRDRLTRDWVEEARAA